MLMPGPRAAIKLRMPHPRDWQREQMPRGCPGGWAPLELIDALVREHPFLFAYVRTEFLDELQSYKIPLLGQNYLQL